MESVSLSWMKYIDIYEYLDINVHTVTFDDKRWKVDVLLDNLEKLFTKLYNQRIKQLINLQQMRRIFNNFMQSLTEFPSP